MFGSRLDFVWDNCFHCVRTYRPGSLGNSISFHFIFFVFLGGDGRDVGVQYRRIIIKRLLRCCPLIMTLMEVENMAEHILNLKS